MTKSELFKAAHKLARNTRAQYATYRAAFAQALKIMYAAAAEVKAEVKAEVETEAEEIQVVIYAADKYINTTVKTVDEARALRDQYRAQIQSYDRWNFKAYNPKIVKFDRWGDIVTGEIEV